MGSEGNEGFVPKREYLEVIRHTQVVSTDLVIFGSEGKVLLGKRANEPAKNTWFVPGGKVRKNETIPQAVKRISKQEVGYTLTADREIGVFHHIYNNNFDNEDFGTHYVVFAVAATLNEGALALNADDQHSELKWWSVEDLMSSPDVHHFTKNYFHPNPWNRAFL
jgi:colanic acid biosynthesis protein WcaH